MPNLFSPAFIALIFVYLGLLATVIAAFGWLSYHLMTGQRLLPSGPPRQVPWRGMEVLAVLVTFIGLMILVPAIYIFVLHQIDPGGKPSSFDRIAATTLVSVPFVVLSWLILQARCGAKLKDLGIDRATALHETFRGMLAWPILAPLIFGINALILRTVDRPDKHPIQDVLGQDSSILTWLVMIFSGVIVAPIAEEFLFRGVLLGWLNRVAMGLPSRSRREESPVDEPLVQYETDDIWRLEAVPTPTPPAVVPEPEYLTPRFLGLRVFAVNLFVAGVFAMMHGSVWPSPVPLFFLALALGFLYQRTGSLVGPIALHMTFNFIPTIILYLTSLAGGIDAIKHDLDAMKAKNPPAAVAKPLGKAPKVAK